MNNYTKELIMNKITKIGLTALAGSLASVAGANAGAISVGGGADITWVNHDATAASGDDKRTDPDRQGTPVTDSTMQ